MREVLSIHIGQVRAWHGRRVAWRKERGEIKGDGGRQWRAACRAGWGVPTKVFVSFRVCQRGWKGVRCSALRAHAAHGLTALSISLRMSFIQRCGAAILDFFLCFVFVFLFFGNVDDGRF